MQITVFQTRPGGIQIRSELKNFDASQNSNTAIVSPRPSPMGQSSSTQGFLSGSNSSPLSALSGQSSGAPPQMNSLHLAQQLTSSMQSQENFSPNENLALGPAALYPEMEERAPGQSRPHVAPKPGSYQRTDDFKVQEKQRHFVNIVDKKDSKNPALRIQDDKHGNDVRTSKTELNSGKQKKKKRVPYLSNIRSKHRNAGKSTTITRHPRYVNSFDESDVLPLDSINTQDSIFDYVASDSESSRSFTPPLPPLSPSDTLQGSELSSNLPLSAKFSRSLSATMLATPRAPDLLSSTRPSSGEVRRTRRASGPQFNFHLERKKSRQSASSKTTSDKMMVSQLHGT